MGRGYLFGLLVGVFASAIGLAGVSLMAPVGTPLADTDTEAVASGSQAGDSPSMTASEAADESAPVEAAAPDVPDTEAAEAEEPLAEVPAAEEPAEDEAVEDKAAVEAPVAQEPVTVASAEAASETPPAQEPSLEAAPAATQEPAALDATAEPEPAAAETATPETSVVEVPAGSEFARPKPEVDPVLPAAEAPAESAPLPAVAAPQAETAPKLAEVSPPTAPVASDTPEAPIAPEVVPNAIATAPATESSVPVPPPGEATAPSLGTADAPDANAPIVIAEAPAAPESVPEPESAPVSAEPAPAAPAPDTAQEPAPVPEVMPAPSAEPNVPVESTDDAPAPPEEEPAAGGPTIIGIAPSPSLATPGAPQPGFGNRVQPGFGQSSAGVKINRLPTIGGATPEGTPEGTSEAEADAPQAAPVAEGALSRYAAAFDNPEDRPLISVILVDLGEAAGGAAPEELAALGAPVTVAIDPETADAGARATVFRFAGDEVAILAPDLPAGATASDIEVSYQAVVSALPETVALVGRPASAFQTDRRIARHVVALLGSEGRGLVTYSRGLDPARKAAEAEGLPHAVIFRDIDAEGENGATMVRYLDRAAFEAARGGAVVVIGTTAPETVEALKGWIASGAKGAAVGPVSAAMLGQNG